MSIHYPDNTASRAALPASGIATDTQLVFDAVYGGLEKSISLDELKKTGVQVYNVKQYGAVGDGSTIDTTAINNAITALKAAGGGILFFPDAAEYLIDGYLPFTYMSNFIVDIGQSIIKMKDAEPVDVNHAIFYVQECSNFVFCNGTLNGNVNGGSGRTPNQVPAHNLSIYDSEIFSIQNIYSINSPVDGFYLGGITDQDESSFTKNGTFINCVADGNSRQGMSIVNAYDIQIFGGAYINTSGLAPQAGIDIERNTKVSTPSGFIFSVDSSTDIFSASGHGLTNGFPITVSSDTILPSGLSSGTIYFTRDITSTTFKIASTYSGTAINIGDSGAGTHTATPQVYGYAGLTPSIRNIRMYGVRFEGNAGTGLHIVDDADCIVVNGCYFADNATSVYCAGNLVMDGCRIERQATSERPGVVDLGAAGGNLLGRSTSITNTTFLGPIDTVAINIHGGFNDDPIIISNNRFIYCKQQLSTNETVIFSNNFIKGGDTTCINLSATGANGSIICNNRFESTTGGQFLSIACNDVLVNNNIFEDCGTSYTLRLWGTVQNQIIRNNIFRKTTSSGVIAQLETGASANFEGNIINGYASPYIGGAQAINRGTISGSGSPSGVYYAAVGTVYIRTDGGTSTTLYIKESGTGNTGWVAK